MVMPGPKSSRVLPGSKKTEVIPPGQIIEALPGSKSKQVFPGSKSFIQRDLFGGQKNSGGKSKDKTAVFPGLEKSRAASARRNAEVCPAGLEIVGR